MLCYIPLQQLFSVITEESLVWQAFKHFVQGGNTILSNFVCLFVCVCHSICNCRKQSPKKISLHPAAHVLENLTELKGQKGKQGLRLTRPEVKLRQIQASIAILSFGGPKTFIFATQSKIQKSCCPSPALSQFTQSNVAVTLAVSLSSKMLTCLFNASAFSPSLPPVTPGSSKQKCKSLQGF